MQEYEHLQDVVREEQVTDQWKAFLGREQKWMADEDQWAAPANLQLESSKALSVTKSSTSDWAAPANLQLEASQALSVTKGYHHH